MERVLSHRRGSMMLAAALGAILALLVISSEPRGAAAVQFSAGAPSAPSRTPPVLGVVGKDPNAKLVALDPRTLARLAMPSPRPLRRCLATPCDQEFLGPVLSPDGRRVAVVGPQEIDVLGRWRFRRLRTLGGPDYVYPSHASEVAWHGTGFAFTDYLELYFVGPSRADESFYGDAVRTRLGWFICCDGFGTELVRSAYDAHRHRLFVISSSGATSVLDLPDRDIEQEADGATRSTLILPPQIDLVHGDFEWAGRGVISWLGAGGLWTIDTRGGPARLVDPTATRLRVSTNALVAWRAGSPTGVRVYGTSGELRFTALPDRIVDAVAVTARYAYVDAGGARYSIDLRDGAVVGPLPGRARLVVPDLLALR